MSMAEFLTVATAADLSEGEMRAFEVGGRRVTVARVGGSLHAFDDTCTHRQCSLAEGDLEEATVTCPCHGSQFDVTTGAVLNPPATAPVPVFPLRVEDDEIQVKM
jgi:3-phenylpropionate/trans-cinnamate dioxygenase ferredoxin subunit